MSNSFRITQLLPSRPGWEVVYWHHKDNDKDYGGKAYHTTPLECWALVEDQDGDTEILGVVINDWTSGPETVRMRDPNFIGFNRVDDSQDWQEEALQLRENRGTKG